MGRDTTESDLLTACGEAIGGRDEGFAHTRVSRGMARATHNHQFTVGPGPGKFPRRDERTAQVEASMDQDAGNVGECTRVAQQHPLFQPGIVGKIVRHKACKRELPGGLQAPGLRWGLGVH